MLLQNRASSITEAEWYFALTYILFNPHVILPTRVLRDGGKHLKSETKSLFAALGNGPREAVSAVFDYVLQYNQWLGIVAQWNSDTTSVEVWHLKNFPILVEQLK